MPRHLRVLNWPEGPLSKFCISTFVYRGNSHRRKSAAFLKFDMVWLCCALIPIGEEGVISSFKWFLSALPRVEEGGGCGSAPCAEHWTNLELWTGPGHWTTILWTIVAPWNGFFLCYARDCWRVQSLHMFICMCCMCKLRREYLCVAWSPTDLWKAWARMTNGSNDSQGFQRKSGGHLGFRMAKTLQSPLATTSH